MEGIKRAKSMETKNQEYKIHDAIYKSARSLNSFRSSNGKEKEYRKILSVSVTRQKQKMTKDFLCGKM